MANKTSKSNESYYAQYKTGSRRQKNRERRLQAQLKAQPNNQEAILAAIKAGPGAWRKTPTSPVWSAQSRRQVELAKYFSKLTGNTKAPQTPKNYSFFALGTRAVFAS